MTIDDDTRRVINASIDMRFRNAEAKHKGMEKSQLADLEEDMRKQKEAVDKLLRAKKAMAMAFEWMEREER